ncbi:MAG: TlpA disulfide reductase family protein [Bacteroidota bacterium]|nr:TlpA disulfide reductase family protein [Bacteroidota bacterium]
MPKKISLILIFVLFALGALYLYNKYKVAPSIDISKLSLQTLDGKPFDIASLKGKKVIMSFSASWCGNCIREMNAMKKIKDTELQGIEIVIIDDEPMETVISFKEKREYPFTFLKVEQAFPSIGIYSIPVTYFYNAKQELTGNEVGEIDWQDSSHREHFKQILN